MANVEKNVDHIAKLKMAKAETSVDHVVKAWKDYIKGARQGNIDERFTYPEPRNDEAVFNGPLPIYYSSKQWGKPTNYPAAGVFVGFSRSPKDRANPLLWHVVYAKLTVNDRIQLWVYPMNYLGDLIPLPRQGKGKKGKTSGQRRRFIKRANVFLISGLDSAEDIKTHVIARMQEYWPNERKPNDYALHVQQRDMLRSKFGLEALGVSPTAPNFPFPDAEVPEGPVNAPV